MNGLVLATSSFDVQNSVQEFWNRLFLNDWRLGWTLFMAVLIGFIVGSTVNKIFAILPALGAGWLAWHIFNGVKGLSTPLFSGEPKVKDLGHFFLGSGDRFLAAMVGAVVGVLVYFFSMKNKDTDKVPRFIRVAAGVSTWFGVTLIYALYKQAAG